MVETKDQNELNIIIISDAAGDTAFSNATAAAAEFPNCNINYRRYPFITNQKKLDEVLIEIEKYPNLVIIYSLVKDEMQMPVIKFAREHNVECVDIFSPVVEAIQQTTHMTPDQKIGAQHSLNQKYFDRISAMEFAVMYDDGKDPKGFLEADVVLLGVSRTSKTPLSLFLANKNLKVANLPLVPETHIPKEIYEIDPKKIIGLTNDPSVLNEIRRQRMIAYGLNPNTLDEAIRVGRHLEKLNYLWFEEPFRDFELYKYSELCRTLDIPIAATETTRGCHWGVAQVIAQRAADIVRADVSWKDGITGTLKIAHMAEAFGLNCEIHTTTMNYMDMVNLHVSCAIKNCQYFEYFVPEDNYRLPMKGDLPIDGNGIIHVPNAPGVGAELDWELIERSCVSHKVLEWKGE